uniref:Thyroglobulin type-1 domain-containing protein n=1 Tax=Cyclopterus lumpus TaxID=8103 RepID=A0A8C2WUR9_CYCLU
MAAITRLFSISTERKTRRPKTHCEHHRDGVQTTGPEGRPVVGAYVPQCEDNGQYLPLQCHGSTGHCWCVDDRGQERAGTRTPPGRPSVDCDRPGETPPPSLSLCDCDSLSPSHSHRVHTEAVL